jgi:hypothetical protein
MLFAVLLEDGDSLVEADAAASVLLDPFVGRICARQLGKRRLALSEHKLQIARSGVSNRLNKLGLDCLRQATGTVRREVGGRLFAAQADADNAVNAARAEFAVALALDAKHEFNKATQRGATLSLNLAEAAWVGRKTRLEGLEDAMRVGVKLINPRMFWVVPRAPTEQPS